MQTISNKHIEVCAQDFIKRHPRLAKAVWEEYQKMIEAEAENYDNPAPEIEDFSLLDKENLVYGKKLYTKDGNEVWAMMTAFGTDTPGYTVCGEMIQLSDYGPIPTKFALSNIGYDSLGELTEDHPADWQKLLLCSLFNMYVSESGFMAYTKNKEEAYATVKEELGPGGVFSTTCNDRVVNLWADCRWPKTDRKENI